MHHHPLLSQRTQATKNAKPTTMMIRLVAKQQRATSTTTMMTTTALLGGRRRDLLPPCLASLVPGSGFGCAGVPRHVGSAALGNRQASPVAASSLPPQQQQQQEQQQQHVRPPMPTRQQQAPLSPWQQQAPLSPWQQQQLQWQQQQQLWRQQQQQQQQQQQAPPPSVVPQQQQQQQQRGQWGPAPPRPPPPRAAAAAWQQQRQLQQQEEQQRPAAFRPQPTTMQPTPPPPPPSLVLPRTAVAAPAVPAAAAAAAAAASPLQQQQQKQIQQQREPPAVFSPPPPPPPQPQPSPAVVVPRAGVMTLEERRAAFSRAALRADASARAKELLYYGPSGAGAAAAAKKSKRAPPRSRLSEGEQRTSEWHALRDARLTASAFGNALGFWPRGRVSLWEEKVGLGKAFEGNAATRWGTEAEPRALEAYVAAVVVGTDSASTLPTSAASASSDDGGGRRRSRSVTRSRVSECRFEVLSEDDAHDWLGASPDGLIEVESSVFLRGGNEGEEDEDEGGAFFLPPPSSSSSLGLGPGGGVLEIKCPFNRGRPRDASPWTVPPHYYVPQVQGLMAVTGREWCDLWCWTPGGSGEGGKNGGRKSNVGVGGASRFRFERDRGYWASAFEVLADFWWAHVVPANQAVAAAAAKRGLEESDVDFENLRASLVAPFRPTEGHPLTASLVERSRAAAERAAADAAASPEGSFFSAEELEEAVARMNSSADAEGL